MSSILRAPQATSLAMRPRPLLRMTHPRFLLLVSVVDLAAITLAVGIGHLVPIGAIGFDPQQALDLLPPPGEGLVSVSVIALWLGCLAAQRAYGETTRRTLPHQAWTVARATALFVGCLALSSLLLHLPVDRTLFLVVPPVGLALLLAGRTSSHRVLRALRARGTLLDRAVILGEGLHAEELTSRLARHPDIGLTLVGSLEVATVDEGDRGVSPAQLVESAVRTMTELRADTLVMPMSGTALDTDALRTLRWALDERSMRLVMVPPTSGVSGERLALTTGTDIALLQVRSPAFSGTKYVLKRGLDLVASAVGILLLTPVWIAIAAMVKVGDGGPVLFRQSRVGLDGREFPMLKFRTMVPDAEAALALLEASKQQDAGNTVLFKMRDDPRITRPGHFLRRFSLDELPQLLNVLFGQMSLVGPRPPLPREVATYEEMVNRRFMVKPGITGLWQTSGRSNLSWEDSVRLDLYYVENWTMKRDLDILMRTARAVLSKDGAY